MDNERYNIVNELQGEMPSRARTNGVTPAIKDIIKGKVMSFLEDKKVYLDPTMSLLKFSSITSTNTTYLSNTVNECFGCSFRVLINKYRIEHAIKLMKADGEVSTDLYKSCGFASRSVFYASFKQITGSTPGKYLKQYFR
ncbi:MAG: helix-turn-helix domain-containing protein [Bacteroidales bacterium]|nr:helix-turn-helix domain-containing protein [Bacteroidales bacterium]